jgi:hybrid cluster-associated redox disulfide protein
MKQPKITANFIVADLLARWPQVIPVFMHHRMVCVDCPIAPFETLAEAAAAYDLDVEDFLQELERCIGQVGN